MFSNGQKAKGTVHHWYTAPDITWRRAGAIGGLAAAVAIAASWLPSGELFENRVSRPIEFQARHLLRRDPAMDPRLRIYAIDDATEALLGDRELTLGEWAKLIRGLSASRPRALFVDKLFTAPHGAEGAAAFVRDVSGAGFPVIAGAVVSARAIRSRLPLDLGHPDFDLTELTGGSLSSVSHLPIHSGVVYGPPPSIRDAFAHIGQFLYAGDGLATGILRVGEDRAIPLAPLYVAGTPRFSGGRFTVGKKALPLRADGKLVVNLAHPAIYAAKIESLSRAARGIPEGSVVVILSSMSTGDNDIVETPFGRMPGGYVTASLANSALTGQWIAPLPIGWLLTLMLSALGAAAAVLLAPGNFRGALAAAALGLPVAGILTFSYGGVQLPWLFPLFAFFLSALPLFAERVGAAEEKAKKIREALEGAVAPDVLAGLMARPATLSLDPAARVVSLMFIDVAGFSVAAERLTPRQAFTDLKQIMASLAGLVHKHGGVVDRVTGDGMFCFFGYRYDGADTMRDHADRALACAVEIQRQHLVRSLQATRREEPVYPLRIGINTAGVYIGDMGGFGRLDPTVIGNGVNLAKRLETACEGFSVMLGASTKDMLLHRTSHEIPLRKRWIQVKHLTELTEAYECDPIADAVDGRRRVLAYHRNFARIDRKDPRWPVPPGIAIRAITSSGSGEIVNFSETGLAVKIERYLGRGVTVNVALESEPGQLRERLNMLGFLPLVCEVRWGTPLEGETYLLGLQIKNLNPAQKRLLLNELRECLSRQMAA